MKHVLLGSGLSLSFLVLQACNRTDSATVASTGATGMGGHPTGYNVNGPDLSTPSRPGGAPNWALGKPMGNGFRDLTANQAGGMGTGLQGFNDVGAAGTSGAITDVHQSERGMDATAGTSTGQGSTSPGM